MIMIRLDERKKLIAVLFITFLVYSNTLLNNFVWDDIIFIGGWDDIRSMTSIPNMLLGSNPPGHDGVYRPLRGVFYTISFALFGTKPLGYRMQAIAVHLACTAAAYMLAKRLSKREDIGLVTALLFGLHPVHAEAISFTTTSFDIIGVIFFFASLTRYLDYADGKGRARLYESYALAGLAFFTYEMTLTLPAMVLLHIWVFGKREDLKAWAPYMVLAFSYLAMRFLVFDVTARAEYLEGSLSLTMLAMTKALWKYLTLTVIPVGLSVNHSLGEGIHAFVHSDYNRDAILAQAITDTVTLFALTVSLGLLTLAVAVRKRGGIASFSIMWFFLGLAPVSNLIPQTALMAERYMYISSFGFCLIVAWGAIKLYDWGTERRVQPARLLPILLIVALTIGYFGITFTRNFDWHDSISLWTSAIAASPDSGYNRYNMGVANRNFGPEGGSSYSHYNLGVAYRDTGDLKAAYALFKRAAELDGGNAEAYYNMGNIDFMRGDIDGAIDKYRYALSVKPWHSRAHANLCLAYTERGMTDLSIAHCIRATELEPGTPQIWNNLGVAYLKANRTEEAIPNFRRALSLDPYYGVAEKNLIKARTQHN